MKDMYHFKCWIYMPYSTTLGLCHGDQTSVIRTPRIFFRSNIGLASI